MRVRRIASGSVVPRVISMTAAVAACVGIPFIMVDAYYHDDDDNNNMPTTTTMTPIRVRRPEYHHHHHDDDDDDACVIPRIPPRRRTGETVNPPTTDWTTPRSASSRRTGECAWSARACGMRLL